MFRGVHRLARKILFANTSLLAAGFLGFNLTSDANLSETVKKGLLAQYRGKYDQAESLFHDAIKLYDKQADKIPVVKTNLYLNLANLYYESKDYKRSFNLFQESLRDLIVNSKYETNNEAIIEISMKMSSIFAHEGRIHAAKVGFEFCQEAALSKLKEYELKKTPDELNEDLVKNIDNIKALYAMICQTYGRYLANLGESAQAISLLEQAKILASNLPEQNMHYLKLSSIMNDLATAYYGIKEYEEARDLLNKSLEYIESEKTRLEFKKIQINDELDRIQYQHKKSEFIETQFTTLANLCSIQLEIRQYDQARVNCLKATRLAKLNSNVNLEQELKEVESLLKKIDEVKRKNQS